MEDPTTADTSERSAAKTRKGGGGNIKIEYHNPKKRLQRRNFKIKIDPNNRIVIKGAREHNLKNVSLNCPETSSLS